MRAFTIERLAMTTSVLLALVTCAAAGASAQECDEGRVRTPTGHCCWAQQTWSPTEHVCVGPPRCPDALVPEGERCVARASEISSAGTIAAVGGYADTSLDLGLVISGTTSLAVGYALGIVFAVIDEAQQNCGSYGLGWVPTNCASWPLSFVPFAGAIAAGTAYFNGTTRLDYIWGLVAGVGASAMQFVGLGLLLHAVLNPVETSDPQTMPTSSAQWILLPGAPATDAGASVALYF